MVETKSRGKLVIYALLFIVLLFSLANFIELSSGRVFNLELAGFFFLALLMILGFIGYASSWGERFFFFFFLLFIANLVAIWYFFGFLYIVLLFFALLGFLLSFPRRSYLLGEEHPPVEVIDSPAPAELESKGNEAPPKRVEASHSPGKYVASKRSNIFHAPKCDWAKKIKKERRVWFKDKKAALDKGYRAHGCAK